MSKRNIFPLSATVLALAIYQIYHYDKDNSGFNDNNDEPYASGYFSPDLFINNVIHLEAGYQFRPDSELRFSAGPGFQYKQEDTAGDEWNTGLDLDLSYHRKISPSFHLTAQGSYYQIAQVYRRYSLTALLTYIF